jgi:Flp pilus assembly protein TadB
MFWLFAFLMGFGLVFIKLGVLSVTVKLLAVVLQVVVIVAIGLAIALVWKSMGKRGEKNSEN